MIVGTNEGGRVHEDQRLKDFPRMHDGQGQGANRDDINADDAVLGIEPTDDELFSIQAFKAGPEKAGGAVEV